MNQPNPPSTPSQQPTTQPSPHLPCSTDPLNLINTDIDNLLNQFQEGNLNLTNQDKAEDESEDMQAMKKIKDEYQKFMKEMQDGVGEDPDDINIGSLGKAFEDLLSGLGDDDQAGQNIGKKFQDIFKNLDTPEGFEKAASDLLNQFMDKSLLEEPLAETKANYEQYFQKCKTENKPIPDQHNKQYKTVCKLIETMKANPNNKQAMIQLFSELQAQGTPPEGIAPSFGLL